MSEEPYNDGWQDAIGYAKNKALGDISNET